MVILSESTSTLPLYRNMFDFYMFLLYSAILLKLLTNSVFFFWILGIVSLDNLLSFANMDSFISSFLVYYLPFSLLTLLQWLELPTCVDKSGENGWAFLPCFQRSVIWVIWCMQQMQTVASQQMVALSNGHEKNKA